MPPLLPFLLLLACGAPSEVASVSPREGRYVATTVFPEFSDCGAERGWAYPGQPLAFDVRAVTRVTMLLTYSWPPGADEPYRSVIPCEREDRTFRCALVGDTGDAGAPMEIHVSGTWKSDTAFTAQWTAWAGCACADTGTLAGADTCMVVKPFRAERMGDSTISPYQGPDVSR